MKKVESLQDSNMSSESRANREKKKNRTESNSMNDSVLNDSIVTNNHEHIDVEPTNINGDIEPVSRVKEKDVEDDIPPPPPPPPLPPPQLTTSTNNIVLPDMDITDVVMEDVDSTSSETR